jgi:hypothetical protein
MPRPSKVKSAQPLTTAQRLSSIVKSCRDIMRKDKWLNGDLDRLPMLTWIMFLKFLDDMEQIAEQEAKMAGKRFRPALEPPYRWRDWAARPEGITGDELISFVNNEEAIRPNGTKGPGLFAYLRSLQGANGAAGNIGISGGNAKSFQVPMPPIPDQHRIVTALAAMQLQVDALKTLQTETAAEIDALLPSILDKAFKGEM